MTDSDSENDKITAVLLCTRNTTNKTTQSN